jgi:hypothetical protein
MASGYIAVCRTSLQGFNMTLGRIIDPSVRHSSGSSIAR